MKWEWCVSIPKGNKRSRSLRGLLPGRMSTSLWPVLDDALQGSFLLPRLLKPAIATWTRISAFISPSRPKAPWWQRWYVKSWLHLNPRAQACYLLSVVSEWLAPKVSMSSFPDVWLCYLTWQKDLADVIKTLSQGDYLDYVGRPEVITRVFIWEEEAGGKDQRNGRWESSARHCWLWRWRKEPLAKEGGASQSWKRQEIAFPLEPPAGTQPWF